MPPSHLSGIFSTDGPPEGGQEDPTHSPTDDGFAPGPRAQADETSGQRVGDSHSLDEATGVKHYVLLRQDSHLGTTVIGVLHGPALPIARARELAAAACTNSACYEERVSAGQEVFRATYGIDGECFRVEGVAPMPTAPGDGTPDVAPRPPLKARAWLLETLQQLLHGDWELVTAVGERDQVVRANPGSPFLGRFPGPNLYYSLHLRLTKEAQALLAVGSASLDKVRGTLRGPDR